MLRWASNFLMPHRFRLYAMYVAMNLSFGKALMRGGGQAAHPTTS